MTNRSTDAPETIAESSTSTDTDTTTYDVLGWAELAPSGTFELPVDDSIEDVSPEELLACLRDDLRDRGFTDAQIDQMRLEIDYTEEQYSP